MQPELFEPLYTLTLTDEELHGVGLNFRRTLALGQWGGAQTLLHELQSRESDGVLTLTDGELDTVYRYAYDYGSGGWQSSFKAVLRAAFRAGWTP